MVRSCLEARKAAKLIGMETAIGRIDQIFREHMSLVASSTSLAPEIALAASTMVDCLRRGGRILACGNGGSAADAQHFACELVGRFKLNRKALSVIPLSVDPSSVTSISNDYGFDTVFERQVEAHGRPGDVLLAISTSGKSPNVVAAAKKAKGIGMSVVGLCGAQRGDLAEHCDHVLLVPSEETPRVQEIHGIIVHVLCEILESESIY